VRGEQNGIELSDVSKSKESEQEKSLDETKSKESGQGKGRDVM
jgi:hypothetical protein